MVLHYSLREQVLHAIGIRIISGELQPGDVLPKEDTLSKEYGVSRTVIREAIRTLEARGLVKSQTGSGTYVRAVKGSDVASSLGMYINTQHKPFSLDELMEIRGVLEIEMVRLAAERASEENINKLQESLENMCHTLDAVDEFSKWDLEFHLQLADACGNPLFGILLEPLTESLFELIWTGTSTPGAAQEACEFHAQILEHVRQRDSRGAVEVMRKHLKQAYRVTAEGLEKKNT